MAQLVVGGVTIPVAPGNASRDRDDFTDRRRAFDGTYRASQTGGAARTWRFRTPPITRVLADSYEATLGIVAAQMCSGDLLGIPTMCCAQIDSGWNAIKAASGHYVELPFTLHEVQPAKLLLKYAPGDTIAGESFSRSTTATYISNAGTIASAAINAKRDNHWPGGIGPRSLLLEDARNNNFSKSQEFDHADWTKGDATISANATTAPDGTSTADKLVEDATTAGHIAYRGTTTSGSTAQAHSVFAKAGERTWCYVQTNLRDGTIPKTWVNLATGAIGTLGTGHTVKITSLAGGWYRIECVVNSAAGGGATFFGIGAATADNVFSYLGDVTKGIYVWGGQHEQDCAFATSYIPTTTAIVTRTADSYSLPFTTPPQEMTVYAKFVESGTLYTGTSSGLLGVGASANPAFFLYNNGGLWSLEHRLGVVGFAVSNAGAAPSLGAVDEVRAVLFGDGSVQLGQSIAGAAEVNAAQSVANPLVAAWNDMVFTLNSRGAGTTGFTALQSFKIVAGARSLTEMRTL